MALTDAYPGLAGKDDRLRTHQDDPPNIGTPVALLDEHRLTPADQFFVRSHGAIPAISWADHRLVIDGLVERPLELSMDDLRTRWAAVVTEAALICAGNRRAGMSLVEPTRSPLQWAGDAVGNTTWAGVPLAAVLEATGVSAEAGHVAFEGADATPDRGSGVTFGGSIPIHSALHGGVLLAFEMGGQPLMPQHGFPLRALVPGYVGARSVKWLTRITVQYDPSDNPYQARDYRIFARDVRPETADWARGIPLGETPIDSFITYPPDGASVPAGSVAVRGYALAGGDRTVERVEVTSDGGASWRGARLVDDSDGGAERRWRWRRWQVEVELPAGDHELAVRAWDSAANTQPADPATIWNFAGYANNSWHRVPVRIE